MTTKYSLGIIGARGHTGAELIALIARHPHIDLTFVSSRELAGQRVSGRGAQAGVCFLLVTFLCTSKEK